MANDRNEDYFLTNYINPAEQEQTSSPQVSSSGQYGASQTQGDSAPIQYGTAQTQGYSVPTQYGTAQTQGYSAPTQYGTAQTQGYNATAGYQGTSYADMQYNNTNSGGFGVTNTESAKKDKTAYIVLFVILGLVFVIFILLTVLFFTNRSIFKLPFKIGKTQDDTSDYSFDNPISEIIDKFNDPDDLYDYDTDDYDFSWDYDFDYDFDYDPYSDYDITIHDSNLYDELTTDEINEMLSGTQEESDVYYSLSDYLVDDLDYKISFETYKYTSDDMRIQVNIQYPVLEGDVRNAKEIGTEIRAEADYWIDFIEKDYLPNLDADTAYLQLFIKPYVTYMSDEVLSIAYSEKIESDQYNSYQVVSVNIDMNSGFKLQNNKILAADEEFAQGLIDKSEIQNGSSVLSTLGATAVLESLNDENAIIIFYTPLGLEVGINHYNGWTTVTYIDYEQYLNSF